MRDDIRLSFRMLARHPAFLMLAVLTLALGIGSTTAIYSALRAVVLDPLPFHEPDRLVRPWQTMGESSVMIAFEESEVDALRRRRDLFTGIEAFASGAATLTGHDEPRRLQTVRMSAGLPALLGIAPVLGRFPAQLETQGDGERVLVLSHALWRALHADAPDALGSTLMLDGEAWTIIGVMPRDAARPDGDLRPVDLWLPLPDSDWRREPIARLADGVTIEHAAAEVDAFARAPDRSGLGGTVVPVLRAGPLHEHLRVLMAAVTLLLLIACVNVSNLLLQRAAVRTRETATRLALGAGRGRLTFQFLLESMLLAAAGGALGVLLAWGAVRMLGVFGADQLDVLAAVRVDRAVLLFCVGVSAIAGMLFGLLPAVHGARAEAGAVLGRIIIARGARPTRLRWSLLTVEVALSFVLLVGAALVAASLGERARRDPGFRTNGLVALEIRLPAWRYRDEGARRAAFQAMIANVRRVPGVGRVALADAAPPRMSGMFGHVQIAGQARETAPTQFQAANIDAEFLGTLGQRLISGRSFTHDDLRSDEHPVLLTESTARRLFPIGGAVGGRFTLEGGAEHTVIGVVADISASGLADDEVRPLGYWPLRRVQSRMTLLAEAAGADASLMLELRRAVHHIEPDAIADIATMRELLGATLARERFTTALLSSFATLALLLAGIGLYGLLSQLVVSRTHEIGIRMALGADAANVRRLVTAQALLATAAGLAAGAVFALAAVRVLRSRLFDMPQHEPGAYLTAAIVLIAVSATAAVLPAARATSLDPRRAIDSP